MPMMLQSISGLGIVLEGDRLLFPGQPQLSLDVLDDPTHQEFVVGVGLKNLGQNVANGFPLSKCERGVVGNVEKSLAPQPR